MTYVAAVNKGGDGRPDFHARKACNYAEDAIQVFCRWNYHCDWFSSFRSNVRPAEEKNFSSVCPFSS